MSIAGGAYNALISGAELGCTTIQIFTKSNNQWRAKPLSDEEVERFHEEQKRTGIKPVIAHDSYLINLCSPDVGLLTKSREAYLHELERCEMLKIPYLVTHPGGHMGQGEEWGIKRIAESIDWLHAQAPDLKVKIALECTAGQGTGLGYKFEHLAGIMDQSKDPERVRVCIDTCHLFAAGYDISNEKGYEQTINEFDRIIGLKHLVAIHLNDSKKPLGSRVDRHDHIGQGQIGEKAFGFFMNDKRFEKIPKLLETPKENDMDRVNLAKLRKLSGVK
jgi:deoxyribonuclease-4